MKRVGTFDGLRHYGGECPGVYYNRLQRDGWDLADRIENGPHDEKVHFEKPLPHGWLFRKVCHEQIGAAKGKGCYWDEHEMIAHGGQVLSSADWEWAERIGDKIVFAQGGCLWRTGVSGPDSLSDVSLVHDLNDYKFDNLKAPY